MATNSTFRLIVVRCDGIFHSSDFSGWHAETAVYRYFNEAKADKRVVHATVFHSIDNPHAKFHVRTDYTATETKDA